jgi:hypothetical protein
VKEYLYYLIWYILLSNIGGSYGHCNQRDMMIELKNGPIVVSFEPDYAFMMYSKGFIFYVLFKGIYSARLAS